MSSLSRTLGKRSWSFVLILPYRAKQNRDSSLFSVVESISVFLVGLEALDNSLSGSVPKALPTGTVTLLVTAPIIVSMTSHSNIASLNACGSIFGQAIAVGLPRSHSHMYLCVLRKEQSYSFSADPRPKLCVSTIA